jgi:cysteine desulfurase/selenocysteine lyase
MPPFLTGGSTITTVTMDHTDFIDPPERFEAGTQMTEQVVGLGAAVRYLQQVGMPRIAAWEQMLGTRLAEGVTTIPGVRLLGPSAGRPRTGLVSVDVEGVHAHDVGQLLDAQGIAVRVGHHCAQPVHHRYGVTASTRASTYLYNTPSEVDAFLDALSGVRHYFGVGA